MDNTHTIYLKLAGQSTNFPNFSVLLSFFVPRGTRKESKTEKLGKSYVAINAIN